MTSVNGRMGSTQKKRGKDWSGMQMGPRPIRTLVLGGLVAVQEEDIASVLGSMPHYSRLLHTTLKYV
jgi:hypothetical protein